MPRYEIYKAVDGEWRWRLVSANGKVVGAGEGYRTRGGAERGVEANRRTAARSRVVVKQAA